MARAGTGAGVTVTDCPNTQISNSIFYNNGATLGETIAFSLNAEQTLLKASSLLHATGPLHEPAH